jgi:hypothetical protein
MNVDRRRYTAAGRRNRIRRDQDDLSCRSRAMVLVALGLGRDLYLLGAELGRRFEFEDWQLAVLRASAEKPGFQTSNFQSQITNRQSAKFTRSAGRA